MDKNLWAEIHHQMTACSRTLLEDPTVVQPVKNQTELYFTFNVYYRVHKDQHLGPILTSAIHNLRFFFLKINFSIILQYTPRSPR
jgi:hypothetical protein